MSVNFTGGGEKDLQNSSYPSTQPSAPKSGFDVPDASGEISGSSIGSTIPKGMDNGTPSNSQGGSGLSSTVPNFNG
jgi:hypothetical protein